MLAKPMRMLAAVLCVVVAVSVLCYRSDLVAGSPGKKSPPGDQIEKKLTEILRRLQQVEKKLESMRTELTEEEWMALLEIQKRIDQVPKTFREVTEIHADLRKLVAQVPEPALRRISKRVSELDWAIEALWYLRKYPMPDGKKATELEGIIEDLLERRPEGKFDELADDLHYYRIQAVRIASTYRKNQLLREAKECIEQESHERAALLYSALEKYEAADPRVKEVRRELRSIVVEHALGEQKKGFERLLEEALKETDESLKQQMLANLQASLTQAIIEQRLENDRTPAEYAKYLREKLSECRRHIRETTKAIEDRAGEHRRLYQKWAIEQIDKVASEDAWEYQATLEWVRKELKKFNNANKEIIWIALERFPSVADLIQQKLNVKITNPPRLSVEEQKEIYKSAAGTFAWNANIDYEIAYHCTREAVVKYLLIVDTRLLEPVVHNYYQQTLSSVLKRLEDDGRKDDLKYIIQKTAEVRPWTLEQAVAAMQRGQGKS